MTTDYTKYKWIYLSEEEQAGNPPQDILNKLEAICVEWDKEKSALKRPGKKVCKEYKEILEMFTKAAKAPNAKQKAKEEAYWEKIEEINLRQMNAIQQLLLKKSEACGPLDCEVCSSRVTYGTNSQFVPMEIIIGGPSQGTTVSSEYSGTELDVKCKEYPQLKKIRFEGAAHIEAGDTIRAYSFRGLRIDHILPNAVNHWYDLIFAKKQRSMPALDKQHMEEEHFNSGDHWLDIDETENLYIPIPPKEIEDCFKIEKFKDPRSNPLITYAIAHKQKD